MHKLALIFVWYFMIHNFSGPIVGPFRDIKECNRIRTEYLNQYKVVIPIITTCWEGP